MKDLNEILEDLVEYCVVNGALNPKIKLQIPKNVLEHYSSQFRVAEAIGFTLVDLDNNKLDQSVIKSYHTQNSGVVELETLEQ